MSDYMPPFVESQETPETDPPGYSEPDVEVREVGPVDPVEYVEPFVHDESAPEPQKTKAPTKKASKRS